MHTTVRFLLIAAIAVSGCASAGTPSGGSDRNRITTEQLARIPAANAYEAIRTLQPQWLDSRGVISADPSARPTTAIVFIDGTRAGDLEYLRGVPINTLSEIRYLTAGEASTRYGLGLDRGVIELISKGR
jgi:hypothetical protein